ncbi:hypothetical protein HQO42_23565 [Rhodococcus fascians]|nr:hypothetical protein [Rhodococcus fascians]MBY4240033.1 hypothetical protein [Rhodococcus fascians]MBY4255637.1 hypothetical protein [Rhodococcus fascians]MBY4271498.1 hypothetical protein [Rhodococcus fascians]
MNFVSWSDEPVTTKDADEFARQDYAKRVAQLISQAHSWESSTVFGLTGPWGSGKTSLINLIELELRGTDEPGPGKASLISRFHRARSGPENSVDANYAVVRFTPWATHDVSGLLGEFFSALTNVFPSGKGKAARKAFATLLRIAAPTADVIPIAGGALSAAAESAAEALLSGKSWEEAFKDATDQIRASNKRILVVVDDVDRLQGRELLAVLKVVRLLGRFPGVQYLLAYDHSSLMQTLAHAGAAEDQAGARRYIEKMVQYPFVVPALIGAQIATLVEEQLAEALQRHRPNLISSLSRVNDLGPTMRATLNTPRAIGRYIAQLDYELGTHLDTEVDDEDVIGLTLLRTTFPELHNKLPRYQYELVTGHLYKSAQDRSSPDERFAPGRLLGNFAPVEKEHALAMLEMLFPKLRSEGAMTIRKGVSQANYFGRYFTMAILKTHDIPDSSVTQAVREAGDGKGGELVALLCSDDQYLALLAFEKVGEALKELLRGTTPITFKDKLCTALLRTVLPISGQTARLPGLLMTNWIGADILPSISDTAPAAPIVEALELAPTTRTKVSILLAAKGSLRLQNQQWWQPILAAALPAVQSDFVAHLSEQDAAPDERRDLIEFLSAAHYARVDLAPLHTAIEDAIRSNQFDIDHLASRFIYPDSNSQISADQVAFDIIAPHVHYSWYDAPRQAEFPDDVFKWAGRRALAVGRLERPSGS